MVFCFCASKRLFFVCQALPFPFAFSYGFLCCRCYLGLYSSQIREVEKDPGRFMMEIRDYITGTYHSLYYQKGNPVAKPALKDLFAPVVAVTYRDWTTPYAMTMYFQVLRPATIFEPAIYQYIGRDSHFYPTLEIVRSNGYQSDT